MTYTDSAEPLDTRLTLSTPEGADLNLYPAGPWLRILAYSIDWLIRAALVILVIILARGSGLMQAAGLIAYFLLEWFYPVFFEVCRNGQTIGKKALGLRVIHDDGTPVTFAGSMLRNLLRIVDLLPVFYLAGMVACVCNRQFKRLGDLAAGTLVVYTRPITAPPTLETQGRHPLPADFTPEEQRMLVLFAQRSATINQDRQAELAQLLTPLLPPGTDPVLTLKRMANTVVGN